MSSRKNSQQDAEEYKAMMAYRDTLQRLAEQSQSDYDKAVMTLSGGALGISFGYLKDVAGPPPYAHSYLLNLSWSAWTLSVVACLFSLGFSGLALRKAIAQLDQDLSRPADLSQPAGETTIWDAITGILNWSGGTLFALGAFLMILFVASNHHEQHAAIQATTAATATAIPAGTGSGPVTTSGNRTSGASPTSQPFTPNPPLIQPDATSNPASKATQPSPTNTAPAP